jgi:ribosomal RNA-processing protein 12
LYFCIFVIEANIKELARFAKNYLPILFNIYTACEEKNDSVSLPILQTLKCYLQITDQQVRIYLGSC